MITNQRNGEPAYRRIQNVIRKRIESGKLRTGADWKTPADVLKAYANASIVGPDQVVFNIKGNDYRLVVAINFRRQIACSSNGLEHTRITTRLM